MGAFKTLTETVEVVRDGVTFYARGDVAFTLEEAGL